MNVEYINGNGYHEYMNGDGPTIPAGDEIEGIVYRRGVRHPGALDAQKYACVWSTNGDKAISIPVGGRDYKPGDWLRYQLVRDSAPIMEEEILNYAVEAVEIKPPVPGSEFQFTVKVHAKVLIRRQRPPQEGGAYSGWTDAIGLVLVPADETIKRRLAEEEQFEVEASPVRQQSVEYLLFFLAVVIYVEERNRWWLATVVDFEQLTWTNLNGLPTLLADLLEQAEQIPRAVPVDLRPTSSATGAQIVAAWLTPKDWNPLVTRDRATDSWGVTVPSTAQSGSTLVYTNLGVLEIPRLECVIGAWLRMTVSLKDGAVTSESEVLRMRQNSAPIQTRLLQGNRRVVFSGIVMREQNGSWLNDYLGLVEDPQKLIPDDSCPERLVEFEYVDDGGRSRLEVIKYHRLHVDGFEASVVDKESFYREEGDYAHQDEAIRAYGRMLEAKHPEVVLGETSGREIGPEEDNIIAVDDFAEGLQETSVPAGDEDTQGRAPTEEDSEDSEDPYSDPSDGSTSDELGLPPLTVLPPPTNTTDESPSRIQSAPVEDSGGSGQREGGFGGAPSGASSAPRQGLAAQHRNVQLPAALSNAQLSIVNVDDYSEEVGGIATSYPAIVVSNRANYAVLYTEVYGLVILKREIFGSDEDYQHFAGLGKWINADMYPVEGFNENVHAFRYICTGGVPIPERIPTTVEGRFVKLFAKCDFREDKLQKVSGDYRVRFEMGWAMCSASLLADLALLNHRDVAMWMVYVKAEHDCHWKILGTDAYVRDQITQATRQVTHKADNNASSFANGDPTDSMNKGGAASDFRPANADDFRVGSSSQRCNVAAPRVEAAFFDSCAEDFSPSISAQRDAASSIEEEFIPPNADDFRPSNAAQRDAAPQKSCFAAVRSADVYHPTEAQQKAVFGGGERDHNENLFEPPKPDDFKQPAAAERSAATSEDSDASAEDRNDEAEFPEPTPDDFRPSSTKVDSQQRSTPVENTLDDFTPPDADDIRSHAAASGEIDQPPSWLEAGAEDELRLNLAPEGVRERLRSMLFDPEPDMADLEDEFIDSEEDGYEADDGADAFVDSDVECVVDGDVPNRWQAALAGTDSSFMPSMEDVAGGSAETVDDPEQRLFAPDPTAQAPFFCPEMPTAGKSADIAQPPTALLDDDSMSRPPTDPNQSSSALTNGSDDGPAYRFGFPRLPARTISSPMNRLVSRSTNIESVAESDIHTTSSAALQQRGNVVAPQSIADEPFGVDNDAWQQPSDATQRVVSEPSWHLTDPGIAATHSAAPSQRTDVNLFDALIADDVAAPSQSVPDLLSFDLVDVDSAAPRGSSDSQVPSGTVTQSNTAGSAATPCDCTPFCPTIAAAAPPAATEQQNSIDWDAHSPPQRSAVQHDLIAATEPCIAAAPAAPTEQPDFIDWNAPSPPQRCAMQRDIAAATHTNRQLMDEIARNNYQPAPIAEDVRSEDMPIDTTPRDAMAMLADDIEEMKIRACHQLKSSVNRDFRRKTLRDMQQETQTLRQIESRRASSRASSRASTAMSNAIRLPQFVDMFAQPHVSDDDETGFEEIKPTPSSRPITAIHQPLPMRPGQSSAAGFKDVEPTPSSRPITAIHQPLPMRPGQPATGSEHIKPRPSSRPITSIHQPFPIRPGQPAAAGFKDVEPTPSSRPTTTTIHQPLPMRPGHPAAVSEGIKPAPSSRPITAIHQPLPIRPGQPAAARHDPFGDFTLSGGGSMTKFDVPVPPPSGPPTHPSTARRNEPLVNGVATPATGSNAVNGTAANFNNAAFTSTHPFDL